MPKIGSQKLKCNILQFNALLTKSSKTPNERPNNVYHLLANYASVNSATPVQLNGVNDGQFTQNNNAFIFTELYLLMGVFHSGLATVYADINDPTLNAINPFQIYPINAALAPSSNPNVMDLRQAPQLIPMNEQFMARANNAAGGAAANIQLWWIQANGPGVPDWSIRPGTPQNPRTFALFTCTVALTVGVWSPLVQVNFPNPLKGGAYQINGANLVCANGTAYRWMFPKQPLYAGRKLQAGGLCDAAYGNNPLRFGSGWLGGQGRFNYFEPPQIQIIANATTGSATYTGYMDLTYLGDMGAGIVP
jgi:hypothetical protein